jgi:3-oxoacyl-[acyl-carrier protein] reductase
VRLVEWTGLTHEIAHPGGEADVNMDSPRWAVVTGAGRGIGRAIALRLATDGYAISLVDIDATACESTQHDIEVGGGRAETLIFDLGDRARVRDLAPELLQRHPEIHVLVNNAGIVRMAHFEEFAERDWDDVMEVNLDAVFLLSRGLVPALRRAVGGASIVNISSVLSLLATEGSIAYLASKAALNHLTRGLAVELGRHGIRVNAVAPGFIRTDMFETNHPPERKAALAKAHSLGRVGEATEVASVVSFLCSADASFVSGAVIPVDGALTCNLAIPKII